MGKELIDEFKAFINRGNVFDAAVGLVLALAFQPVVTGFVDNIIMPFVARIFGEPSFDQVRISLGGDPKTYINVGTWITTVIGFVLLAFVVFWMVKLYNAANKPADEDDGPSEIDLLTEIRDNLKNG